jgi:DNA-binding FrmR family transcriptional regulator
MTQPKKGSPHTSQLKRLKRIEGQIRGLSSMIEEERYCIDILTQFKAVRAALSSIEKKIIEEHLNHCVHNAVKSKDAKLTNQMLEEISGLLKSAGLK